jgi:hypothetical protein
MSLPLRPYVRWGFDYESEYAFQLPQLPWTPARGGVGGSDVAASGIPEAYVIRRDRIHRQRWRVLESELAIFDALLDWCQDSGQPAYVRADADIEATERLVYLQAPRWEDGADVEYARDDAFPHAFVIEIAWRTEDGSPWALSWSELATEAP